MDKLRTDEPYRAGRPLVGKNNIQQKVVDDSGNTVVIDFDELCSGKRIGKYDKLGESSEDSISEGQYAAFGAKVKSILNAMFGGMFLPLSIRGKKSEVEAFKNVLLREMKYIEGYTKDGAEHPQTVKKKAVLDAEADKFQRVTGIKWPFK